MSATARPSRAGLLALARIMDRLGRHVRACELRARAAMVPEQPALPLVLVNLDDRTLVVWDEDTRETDANWRRRFGP